MENKRRPADLGNDDFSIRTTTEGVMTAALLKAKFDLKVHSDRVIMRRFAKRILEMCDWWEARTTTKE